MAFNFRACSAGITNFEIKEWTVWFQTPFGLFGKLSEAVKQCEDCDIDPNLGITPVPIALSENNDYEAFRR